MDSVCFTFPGMCVVFTYFWHITFFGGCLAVSGYAESQNRHAITCCSVMPKSLAGKSFPILAKLKIVPVLYSLPNLEHSLESEKYL